MRTNDELISDVAKFEESGARDGWRRQDIRLPALEALPQVAAAISASSEDPNARLDAIEGAIEQACLQLESPLREAALAQLGFDDSCRHLSTTKRREAAAGHVQFGMAYRSYMRKVDRYGYPSWHRRTMARIAEELSTPDLRAPGPRGEAADSKTRSRSRAQGLPARPPQFLDRDLQTDVDAAIARRGLVLLRGAGGVGKSVLAAQAARNLGEELPAAELVWVSCESGPSQEDLVRQISATLYGDRREALGVAQLWESLEELLAGRPHLIILDNFETIADDAEVCAWLAPVRSPLTVLLTSTEVPRRLRCTEIEISELTRKESVSLLTAHLRSLGIEVPHSPGSILPDLCSAVGDHPLAIELIAARARTVPLDVMLNEVRGNLDVLRVRGTSPYPDRHRSVAACFHFSLAHVSTDAAQLLGGVSALPAGASYQLASQVFAQAEWDEHLDVLISASLLRLSDGRYVVPPLLRAYVLERHITEDMYRDVCRRVISSVASSAPATAAPNPDAALRDSFLDWLESEWPNVLVAFDSIADDDLDSAMMLVRALPELFRLRGYWTQCYDILSRAAVLARRTGGPPDVATVLATLAMLEQRRGRWTEAELLHRESMEIFVALGDQHRVADALGYLCRLRTLQRDFAEAELLGREARRISMEMHYPEGESRSLNYLGNIHRDKGALPEAESCYRGALAIGPDPVSASIITNNLGEVVAKQGRLEEAEALHRAAVAINQGVSNRIGEGATLCDLGRALVAIGEARWDEADACFATSVAIAESEYSDDRGAWRALFAWAGLERLRGRQEHEEKLLRRALEIVERTQDSHSVSEVRAALQAVLPSP